ncbi:DUF1161 domain-containing protein [Dyella sp. C11]|uniref:DUF1161 domain-containing protein n=1 Tax=Dyella sp. C11 TaxID=2126991 RepID=UPI000D6581D7|nr:DUF1161 domain-containing protein [Dyella sp. C11]
MKIRLSIIAFALTLPLFAHASCDTVKSDIDAKIKANGVSNYSLDVVPTDQADKSNGTVVGHCEGDKAIIYTRAPATAGTDNTNHAPAVAAPAPMRSGQTGG